MIEEDINEVTKRFGDFAQYAQHETVMVSQDGCAQVVIISAREYSRLCRLDRQVYSTAELPIELREEIREAEPSAEAAKFNGEI